MPSEDLVESWDRTRGHLARAWVELSSGTDLTHYQEFLDHNELGLAMEALANAGNSARTPAAFWEALADAADEMQLSEAAGEYRQRASTS